MNRLKAAFLVHSGIEQSHVVTPDKTCSLHKPAGWTAAAHGIPECSITDTPDKLDAKLSDAEGIYIEQFKAAMVKVGEKAGKQDLAMKPPEKWLVNTVESTEWGHVKRGRYGRKNV